MKTATLSKTALALIFSLVLWTESSAQFVVNNHLPSGLPIHLDIAWGNNCIANAPNLMITHHTVLSGGQAIALPPGGYDHVVQIRVVNTFVTSCSSGAIGIGHYGSSGAPIDWITVTDCSFTCSINSGTPIPLYDFCPMIPGQIGVMMWNYCGTLPISGGVSFAP